MPNQTNTSAKNNRHLRVAAWIAITTSLCAALVLFIVSDTGVSKPTAYAAGTTPQSSSYYLQLPLVFGPVRATATITPTATATTGDATERGALNLHNIQITYTRIVDKDDDNEQGGVIT